MDNTNFYIKEFVGAKDLPKISCLIRILDSDFIVTEIFEDGKVLEFKGSEVNVKDEEDVKEEEMKSNDRKVETFENDENYEPKMKRLKLISEEVNVKDENMDFKEEEIKSNDRKVETAGNDANDKPGLKRPKLISEEDLTSIDAIVAGKLISHTIPAETFKKRERKLAHAYIRERYNNSLVSNLHDNLFIIKKVDDQKIKKRLLAEAWPKSHDDFLYFVMTKKNMNHMRCLNIIARHSGSKASAFYGAEMKDHKAITSQLVCAYHVSKEKLLKKASLLKNIWISNLQYSKQALTFGYLKGNRFSIVLRDVGNVSEDELKERIENWSNGGFFNYFGYQRFGYGKVNAAEIGRFILSGKWEEAVKTILEPRETSLKELYECLQIYKKSGDADQALQKLPSRHRNTLVEGIILNKLKNKSSFENAIMTLFHNIRSIYVRTYQSLVFNKILTKRAQKYGTNVLEGDVLLKDGQKIKSVKGVKIEEIMLPLLSIETNLPENEVLQWYDEILAEDGLTKESFKSLPEDFTVYGGTRALVIKPANVQWELLTYNNAKVELQSSPFVVNAKKSPKLEVCSAEDKTNEGKGEKKELEKETDKIKKERKALKIQFELPRSSYATIALRELLRTDFSKGAKKLK